MRRAMKKTVEIWNCAYSPSPLMYWSAKGAAREGETERERDQEIKRERQRQRETENSSEKEK
jgi:hypothetical protein